MHNVFCLIKNAMRAKSSGFGWFGKKYDDSFIRIKEKITRGKRKHGIEEEIFSVLRRKNIILEKGFEQIYIE